MYPRIHLNRYSLKLFSTTLNCILLVISKCLNIKVTEIICIFIKHFDFINKLRYCNAYVEEIRFFITDKFNHFILIIICYYYYYFLIKV